MAAAARSRRDSVPAFPAEGLAFLAKLRKNNNTEWFHANKEQYRALVQEPALAITAHVNAELAKFAGEYVTAKKNPLSRPNRDVRFSKDKSPYRTDVSVVFPRNGLEKHQVAGYFFRIDPDGVELVAGAFMPGPDELRKLRDHLVKGHGAFLKAAGEKRLVSTWGELRGDALKRVPKGYDAGHPAEALLRMTQFYFTCRIPASRVRSGGFATEIVDSFRVAAPFVRTLDSILGN